MFSQIITHIDIDMYVYINLKVYKYIHLKTVDIQNVHTYIVT